MSLLLAGGGSTGGGGSPLPLPPTISSSNINTSGLVLTVVFSESVTGNSVPVVAGHTVTYTSGSGSNTFVYAIDQVYDNEVLTLGYFSANIQNGASVVLNDISGIAITNNSIVIYSEPATYDYLISNNTEWGTVFANNDATLSNKVIAVAPGSYTGKLLNDRLFTNVRLIALAANPTIPWIDILGTDDVSIEFPYSEPTRQWGVGQFGSGDYLIFQSLQSFLDATGWTALIWYKPVTTTNLGLIYEYLTDNASQNRVLLGTDGTSVGNGNFGFSNFANWTTASSSCVAGSWNLSARYHRTSTPNVFSGLNGNGFAVEGGPHFTPCNGLIQIGNPLVGDVACIAFYNTTHTSMATLYTGGVGGDGFDPSALGNPIHILLFDVTTNRVIDVINNAAITTVGTIPCVADTLPFDTPTLARILRASVRGTNLAHAGTLTVPSNVPVGSTVDLPVMIEHNTGSSAPIYITSVSVTGDLVLDYPITASIPFGFKRSPRVRLSSATAGSKTGTVVINSDAAQPAHSFTVNYTVSAVTPVSESVLTLATGGTPPTDPVRTTYKVKGTFTKPYMPKAIFGQHWIGVIAHQNGGIKEVTFWSGGNTVTINTTTFRDGVPGFYCSVAAGQAAGNYQVYATIVPNDPYAQNRVIGPYQLTKFDGSETHIYVSPTGSDVNDGLSSGAPKQTVAAARLLLASGGVMELMAGAHNLPTNGSLTQINNATLLLVRPAPAVTRSAVSIVGGSFLVDSLHLQNVRVDVSTSNISNRNSSKTLFDSIEVYNSLGKLHIYSNGFLNQNYGLTVDSGGEYQYESCWFHDCYRGTLAAAWNCLVEDIVSDISISGVMINFVGRRTSVGSLRTINTRFAITYSGAAITATCRQVGSNGNASTFYLTEDGVDVLTVPIVIGAPSGGQAQRTSELVTLINARAGWTATLVDNALAAAYHTVSGVTGFAGFPAQNCKSVIANIGAGIDVHADIWQQFGGNVIDNNFVWNFDYDDEGGSGAQGIFLTDATLGFTDGACLFYNVKRLGGGSSKLSAYFDNYEWVHNTITTQPVIARYGYLTPPEDEFVPTNCVMRECAYTSLSASSGKSDLDGLYKVNNFSGGSGSGGGYGNVNNTSLDMSVLNVPNPSSPVRNRTVNGVAHIARGPSGALMPTDGTGDCGAVQGTP